MIPHMQQGAGQCQPAPNWITLLNRHQRETKPDENDADIFDAVIGEQALEIMLPQREGHAQYRTGHAQHRHHPTRSVRHRQPTAETHEAIDAHLERHTRKHGRDVTRCVSVRGRQPNV